MHRGRKSGRLTAGEAAEYQPTLVTSVAAPASGGGNTGARIKVTRNVMLFKDPEGRRRPWLDVGAGLAVDVDSMRLQPVARIKIRDMLSIKVGGG